MALSITPGVNEWAKQLGAFRIIFKAYDDNGNQCIGEHLCIQYGISYDDSEPDLTNMVTINSDASGIIAMTISTPCVISIYGTHSHDINDPTKGKITQEIALNHRITFEPIIIDIEVEYTGPDLFVSDEFDISNLLVRAKLNDGSTKIIDTIYCTIENNDYIIKQAGNNLKTLLYEDLVLNTIWSVNFYLDGISKLLSLEAEYIGESHPIGSRIYSDEVIVKGVFLTELNTTEIRTLSSAEWEFLDLPIITEVNQGVFRILYRDTITQIIVAYTNVNSLRLNVWYEGAKIEVGKSYDINDVVIYLIYPNGKKTRIGHEKCQVSSYEVKDIGWNWYTLNYSEGQEKAKQEFAVPGVILRDYEDLEFQVLYIKDEEIIDMTEDFEAHLEIDGILTVDWTQFLIKINELQNYGLYRVTVPKLSGLSDRYDMKWEVLCINETTLKASIRTIYNEEDY